MGLSNAERQRRYVARLKEQAKAAGGDDALRAELAATKAEIAALKIKLDIASTALRGATRREPSKPKTEKPPLPPDEVRDRQIKSLKTRVRTLTAELEAAQRWSGAGRMNVGTRNAIAKALHPDRTVLSEAEQEEAREEAFKLFNAWKTDNDKARRATR